MARQRPIAGQRCSPYGGAGAPRPGRADVGREGPAGPCGHPPRPAAAGRRPRRGGPAGHGRAAHRAGPQRRPGRAGPHRGHRRGDAGNIQWGDKMQDDITWGIKYLVQQGIADPKRVGIMGGSYGGYATLAGVTYTPDLYAAAVAYCRAIKSRVPC